MKHNHYPILAVMAVVHFAAMYVLMYSMVDTLDDVYPNMNQFYMAGTMTAPMLILELLLMRSMYGNGKLNVAIIGASTAVLVAFFLFIRQQTAIGDTQFLKSMIPHHSGAVLMCEQAAIKDPDIRTLCQDIIKDQQEEIAQMKAKLRELDR